MSDILSRLEVEGTLYFRTSFTSPWGVRVPAYKNVARFHFVHRGGCFVRIGDAPDAVALAQGDFLIIPRGVHHTLYCDVTTEPDALPLERVIEESGFDGHGTLVYGTPGSHQETQLICGHFAFDDNAKHPLLESLPDHIHIKNYGEAAGRWMESTLKLIGSEAGRDGVGSDFIAVRMSEIILAQALRTFFESEGAEKPVFSAFLDPKISSVLSAIHSDPSKPLTLSDLAGIAGMSRTSFATRFTSCMTMTPLKYVTFWRMQIARQQLIQSSDPIVAVAEQVGYQSEAAFGRVFKKHLGVAPASYRRRMLARSGM